MTETQPVPKLLTVRDLAERLGVSVDWSYRLCERGDIAVTRVGSRIRITEESLAEYVASRTAPSRRSRRGAAA